MATSWTKINKATGTSWTKITKALSSVPSSTTAGSPIGLLLALTYASTATTGGWTKINKATGTSWTKITKAT